MTTESIVKNKPVELWDIDKLIPFERNAKKHSPEQIKALTALMKKRGFNFSKAIEIKPDGLIINGHGRHEAATAAGIVKVPVVVIDYMDDDEIRAYRLEDNEVISVDYDTMKKAEEIEYLQNLDVDMQLDDVFTERDLDFSTEDLGEINIDALTGDIAKDVAERTEETKKAIEEEDGKEFSLFKVFGYNTCNSEQQRTLAHLQGFAETQTKLEGAEALATYARDFMGLEDKEGVE